MVAGDEPNDKTDDVLPVTEDRAYEGRVTFELGDTLAMILDVVANLVEENGLIICLFVQRPERVGDVIDVQWEPPGVEGGW